MFESKNAVTTDILIIGAGAAGLAAARELKAAGRKFMILEARSRVGGRAHTVYDTASGSPIELGAEFIHGYPNPVWELLPKLRIPIYDVADGHHLFEHRRLRPAKDYWSLLERLLKKLKSNKDERSFAEFLEQPSIRRTPKKVREQAIAYVEGFHAALPEKISEASLARAENQNDEGAVGRMFRLSKGYGELFSKLEQIFSPQLHLGSVVKEIRWQKHRVQAITTDKCFEAKKILMTIPLHLLKTGAEHSPVLNFDPEPVGLQKLLSPFEMGHIAKLDFVFKHRFWEQKKDLFDFSFAHAPSLKFQVWWTSLPNRFPLLTAWTGGRRAIELNSLDPDELKSLGLKELSKLLGFRFSQVEKEFVAMHTHNWSHDPFSLGAYSYLNVGGLAAQKKLQKGIDDTLFFAGEALNPDGQTGTVDGAMASGIAMAKAML